MSSDNNVGKKTLPPQQDREDSKDNSGSSTDGTNTKQVLQDLKADQEQFYSRIAKIAQSEIAASPPFNQQFEKILQNSAKRIAEIDEELKKLEEEEEQHPLIKLRDTGDDNEMVVLRTATAEAEDNSGKCVCKRSLTTDGKCPTCSHKPDDCNCDQDTVPSDNAAELQAMAGGGGEMGSSPQGVIDGDDDQTLPSDQR